MEKVVDLGSPFSYACPAHQPSYGAIIAWEGNNNIQFKRSDTRAIVPFTGDLFIVYVTEKDIDDINGLGGIRCTMYAANTFYSSGALTVRKRTPGKKCLCESNSMIPWKTSSAFVRRAFASLLDIHKTSELV